jgi:hypothetical protein
MNERRGWEQIGMSGQSCSEQLTKIERKRDWEPIGMSGQRSNGQLWTKRGKGLDWAKGEEKLVGEGAGDSLG